MPNFGMVGAGGVAGVNQTLQEILAERYKAQLDQQEQDRQQQQLGIQQRSLGMQEESARAQRENMASDNAARDTTLKLAQDAATEKAQDLKRRRDLVVSFKGRPGITPQQQQAVEFVDAGIMSPSDAAPILFPTPPKPEKSSYTTQDQWVYKGRVVPVEHDATTGKLYVNGQEINPSELTLAPKPKTGADEGPPPTPEEVDYWVRQVQNDPTQYPMMANNQPLQRAVQAKLAGGPDLNKLTIQSRQMAETAKEILPHLKDVEAQAKQIDDMGLLGPIAGRWSDLITHKIGSGELAAMTAGITDPVQRREAAQLLGKFHTNLGLLMTGVARAHGGARGGSSPTMIEHMKGIMDASGKDLYTFLGEISGVRDWMETYASMVPTSNVPGHGGQPDQTPDATTPGVTLKATGKPVTRVNGVLVPAPTPTIKR